MILGIVIKSFMYCAALAVVAFFAGVETAITSLSTLSLNKLKSRHPRRAELFAYWETRPNEVIATLLVCTNLGLIATAVLSTSIALDLAAYWSYSTTVMMLAVSAVSIVVTLVGGDIIPKIFSRYRAEGVAVFGIGVLVKMSMVFRFVNLALLAMSERIIRLLRLQASKEKPFLQAEELKVLLTSDETLPKSTRRMMRNILEFGKTRISRVMVPRDKIQAVSLDQTPEKVIEQIIEKEYSRVPVYRGNLDNIVGIIYSKDLALAWRGGSLFVIDDLIRPAYFVPGSARIDKVLREFKSGHQHMAVIVDEFGSTIGLATIEDLVEEIVGEIWDEYDIQEKTIFSLPDGSSLLKAGESLYKVNDDLGLNLPANDFSTVGGWVLDLFGRIPKPGDTVRWDNLEIEITDADKKHVIRVRIRKVS